MMTRENFALIAETFFDNAEIVEFCNKEMARLDRKAEEKKAASAENQALTENILATLDGEEGKAAADIGIAIGVSTQKANYLLRTLFENGQVKRQLEGRRYVYTLA